MRNINKEIRKKKIKKGKRVTMRTVTKKRGIQKKERNKDHEGIKGRKELQNERMDE